MASRRRVLVPTRLTSTDMRAEMQHAEGWRSAELVEANHVWDSNELRELILSQCSLRCLHARCAVVCSSWRLTVASPMYDKIDLSISRPQEHPNTAAQPHAEWFQRRICPGGSFERITSLNLTFHTRLGDSQLQHISCLLALQELDLSDCNQITDATLHRLSHLPHLGALSLLADHRTLITDDGLLALAELPLWSLKLDCCATSITDQGFASLAPLGRTLTSLVLSGRSGWDRCWCTAETLRLMGSSFPLLNWVNIGGLGLKESDQHAFAHLAKLKHLTTLYAIEAEINDEGLRGIGQIHSLTSLNLEMHTLITDVGLNGLRGLLDLEEIDLSSPESGGYLYRNSEVEARYHWTAVSRISDDGLAPLVHLAENGALTSANISGNPGPFPGALDALRKDPFCLKYTGRERGDSFDRRIRRFWWNEHFPDGPNALRLTELDVYLGDDGIDDESDG
jgi:hypothetical protein